MKAFKLKNGNLLIPKVARTGDIIGDGMIEVEPDSDDYKDWISVAEDEPPE
jgi:hypothetical protein